MQAETKQKIARQLRGIIAYQGYLYHAMIEAEAARTAGQIGALNIVCCLSDLSVQINNLVDELDPETGT